jgi:hypothetical protein
MSNEPPELKPHGDPLRPHAVPDLDTPDAGAETKPSDLPAPEPKENLDPSGDDDPGAGAD